VSDNPFGCEHCGSPSVQCCKACVLKESELAALREQLVTCLWMHDDSHCKYDTACGHAFQFLDDGIAENGFTHCPFCGGRIEEVTRAGQ
jgi:hypothetical protein